MPHSNWFAIPLTAILLALAALHVYWALGGRWGIAHTIPTINQRPVINPGPLATFVVAALLTLAAWLVASRTLTTLAPWTLSLVFALRAIGEFRLVGFFKRIKGTDFARWDTRLYSPLCLLMAALAAGLAATKE